jgi:hypothetical protein
MQDVAVRETLSVEAKLTRDGLAPRQAPTLDVKGVLDVRASQQVYLDLDAADVSGVYREGADLVLVGPDQSAVRLQGFFSGDTPRRLFLEGKDHRLVAVDTTAVASESAAALVATPLSELSPFVSLTQAGGAAIDGAIPIMEVEAVGLHQRVGVVLGDPEEVALIAEYGRTG